MCDRHLCLCLLFFVCMSLSLGVRMYPCGNTGYQDVEENDPITFYCDQYNGSVTWKYKSPIGSHYTPVGFCRDTYCESGTLWTVTYISGSNSSVTTTYSSRIFSGSQYWCGEYDFVQMCHLHVIVSAVVSQPTTNITRQDSGYTWSVSADITQVYSSRGLYSCVWQLGSSNQTIAPDLDPSANNISDLANRTGRCDVTMPLKGNPGTYPCSVTINPGNTQKSCDSIVVARPSPPTVSCPGDVIAENTSLTCTCTTDNIGQPGGRLRWYTGIGGDVSSEVVSGGYDVTTLVMTWTVTRDDHLFRKFRCVNNWILNVIAQSDYTPRVGAPVRAVQLTINSQTPVLEVRESPSTDVVFQCTVGFTRPSPHLVLSDDQGRELARLPGGSGNVTRQQSVLTYTLKRVRCEYSAVYTCTADNGMGKPVNSSATLRVLCKMRILSDSFSSEEGRVPVLDACAEQGELHFQVLTTETPHIVGFLYLGPDSTGAVYPTTSGFLSATCAQTSVVYKSRCVLKASGVKQDQIGYYNVTIATATQIVSFTFRLRMKQSSQNGSPSDTRLQWFGVGLGAGLAILVVVVLVVLLCLWRRQWRLPCAERSSSTSVDEPSVPVEPSLETEMSAYVTSGPYEDLKHDDIGVRSQYSGLSYPLPVSNAPDTDGGYEIPLQRSGPGAATRP